MKNNYYIKPENAFGIVEVLIAIGLVGIMAVGISGMLTGAMKQQKGIQAKDQQREITSEVRNLLNDNVACKNSFAAAGNNPQTGFTVTQIKDGSAPPGAVKYAINTKDKSGLLTFTEFKINNWVADSGSTTSGVADLKIKLSKVGDTASVKEINPDIITLKITRDGAGNITDCISLGKATDGFWKTATNPSDIYFSGGNVGVGVNDPQSKLDIAGDIKISNAGAACAGANEGSQRYNSIIKNMEFCNGTSWQTMGGGSGLGVGQTWQNVTTSRSSGVTYTNNTGKPILVRISANCPWSGTSFYINGVVMAGAGGDYNNNAGMTMVVPNGDTYKYVGCNIAWTELR